MRYVLRKGCNDIECHYGTPANRGATLCVSSGGTDALGYCRGALFMTEQGPLNSSLPEPGCVAIVLPGLDVTDASICKRSL